MIAHLFYKFEKREMMIAVNFMVAPIANKNCLMQL
jgi:hypothetical protein